MKIKELSWVMENRDKLSKEDYEHLQQFDLFNQFDSGELANNAMKLVEALGLVIEIYEKHN